MTTQTISFYANTNKRCDQSTWAKNANNCFALGCNKQLLVTQVLCFVHLFPCILNQSLTGIEITSQ